MPYKATQTQKSKLSIYAQYSTFGPIIIIQIPFVWLADVFKPTSRTVLETLETQECIEHNLFQKFKGI